VTSGKVQANDFMTAIGRNVLYEIPFEAKSLATAENLGEAPREKGANGFNQMITRIGGDLTGQQMNAERSFFQKLRLRRG
jgi:pilus assembly protein CpaE